jgi:CBS domain containing-hemolysin-like protein
MPGEVVVVGKTRLEVLASTDRRVERLRVSAMEAPAA